MSITDELRAWGDSRAMESTRNVIHVIADRIDAEHERELRAHWNNRPGAHVVAEAAIEVRPRIDWSLITGERQDAAKVYLVEVSDELIESWYPLGVYLNKETAEDCAEAYRREEDGVLQFARVSELKVVDE